MLEFWYPRLTKYHSGCYLVSLEVCVYLFENGQRSHFPCWHSFCIQKKNIKSLNSMHKSLSCGRLRKVEKTHRCRPENFCFHGQIWVVIGRFCFRCFLFFIFIGYVVHVNCSKLRKNNTVNNVIHDIHELLGIFNAYTEKYK